MKRNFVNKSVKKPDQEASYYLKEDITSLDVRRVFAKAFSKMESLIEHDDPRIQLMAANQMLKLLSEHLPSSRNIENSCGMIIEFACDNRKAE